MALAQSWPVRVAAAHSRFIASIAAGFATYFLLPRGVQGGTRIVLAWDAGALLLLVLLAVLFTRHGDDESMAANAERQQDGEWTIFAVVLAGAAFSFVALATQTAGVKDMEPQARGLRVALIGGTLLGAWLVTHTVFALRYAHEYYTGSDGAAQPIQGGKVDGGLDFPGDDTPDYWDFLYFAYVLGMTFQVSDVQITSRKLRRLATAHGLIGFLFNTVIVALTVNIAASLMG